jgi:hypothetical protein
MTATAPAGNRRNEPLHARIIRVLLRLPLKRGLRFNLRETLIGVLYRQDEKGGGEPGRTEGARFELGLLDEEREAWLSRQLVRQARKLRVPVPPTKWNFETDEPEEPWERGSYTGEYYLSETGYKQLRDAIREERKARREARAHMINWLAAWTGVLGALAAVISAYVGYVALTR